MDLGGASFIAGVARAALAIRARRLPSCRGHCRRRSLHRQPLRSTRIPAEWQDPVGLMGPPGVFGLLSSRYEAQYGPVQDALAKLAVNQRQHALLNRQRVCQTTQAVDGRGVPGGAPDFPPINLLDCVMSCDGANAVLVTSRRDAGALAERAVRIRGFGERTNHEIADPVPDITRCGHAVAGAKALRESGLRAADIAMLQPYDDFLIAIVLQLEALGFCRPGEGGRFVLETDLSHRGALPINTGGGQISCGQAGLAGGGLNFRRGGAAAARRGRRAASRESAQCHGHRDRLDPVYPQLEHECGDGSGGRSVNDRCDGRCVATPEPGTDRLQPPFWEATRERTFVAAVLHGGAEISSTTRGP
jgi:acetyl-CoA acetyltransferase